MKNLQPTTHPAPSLSADPFDHTQGHPERSRTDDRHSEKGRAWSGAGNLQLKAFLSFVVSSWLLVAPFSALASQHLTDQPGINLSIKDVLGIITGLACWITQVALVFIVVAVVYFGVKFLMAQGDPTKLTEARKSFVWGLVGIIVILGTYTIIATVATNLGIENLNLIIPLSCPAF